MRGNHTSERYTGTLGEMLLTILAQSAFPLDWWYTICRHAITTITASPRSKRVNTERGFVADRISFFPLDCWNNKTSPHQMEHIHPFVVTAFLNTPMEPKNVWVKSHSFLSSKEPIVSTTTPGKVTYHSCKRDLELARRTCACLYACRRCRPWSCCGWTTTSLLFMNSVYEKLIDSLKLKFDLTEKRQLTEFIGMQIKFESK